MTPPTDDESIEIGACVTATAMQSIPTESSQVSSKLVETPVVHEMPSAESEGEEENEMVDVLEDLILEAYNNMQIDGEFIVLPKEVAEKLHRVADKITLQQSEEKQQKEEKHSSREKQQEKDNIASTREDSSSVDAAASYSEVEEMKVLQQETRAMRPNLEQRKETKPENAEVKETEKAGMLDKHDNAISEDKMTRLRKVQAALAEVAELREKEQHKQQQTVRGVSTERIFRKLASVPEIDESALSGPPSPSTPLSRSYGGSKTPKASRRKTPVQSHERFSSPSLMPLTFTPSPSPNHIGKSPVLRTPDQSNGSNGKSKKITYETRREAALKQKEDKKKRELLVRETARKQREDAKRKLEEVHQREMEEKRERVRRIREERLQRRTGKSTSAKETKKNG